MENKKCLHCESPIIGRTEKARYCTRKCHENFKSLKRRNIAKSKKPIEQSCKLCENLFIKINGGQKFCSRKCTATYHADVFSQKKLAQVTYSISTVSLSELQRNRLAKARIQKIGFGFMLEELKITKECLAQARAIYFYENKTYRRLD